LIDTGKQVSVGTPIAVLAADGESIEQALADADLGAAADDVSQDTSAQDAAAQDAAAPTADTPASTSPAAPAASGADGARSADAAAPAESTRPDGARVFMSPLVRRLASER